MIGSREKASRRDTACGRIARMDEHLQGSLAAPRARAQDERPSLSRALPAGRREVLGRYRDYLKTLYEEVRRQALAGRSDWQIKPEIVRLLSGYRDWANFDDEVGRHVGFAVQEAESE